MADRAEVTRILKMVEAGQVTAEEASELISALDVEPEHDEVVPSGGKASALKIRVFDEKGGKNKVNLTIPLGLVDLALSIGSQFIPKDQFKDIDIDEIRTQLRNGLRGTLIDVHDEEDGEHVVIEAV